MNHLFLTLSSCLSDKERI